MVRLQGRGLVQHAKAFAPFGNLLPIGCGGDRPWRSVRDGVRVVVAVHAVVAQTTQQLPVGRYLHEVLRIDAPALGLKVAGGAQHAAAFIHPRAIVGRADRRGGLVDGHAALGGTACAIHFLFFMCKVEARQQFVAYAQCLELVTEVALQVHGVHVLDFQVVPPRETGGGTEVRQACGHAARLLCCGGQANGACALVALELACTHLRLEFGAAFKPVHMGQGHHAGAAIVVVALRAVVVGRIQRQQRGVGHASVGCGPNPGHAVVHAVVVVQVVQADGELVARADTPGVGACNAVLVQAAARAVVVGLGGHGIDAQSGVFAGVPVEVASDTAVRVVAQRQVHLVGVDQSRCLAHLVDGAAGRSTPKQHGGGAAQHFHAIQIEGIALVERWVAHAVDEHVARALQGKAAQANVFFAAFRCQEGDACGVFQCFLDGVEVAIIDQAFGHHGDRLRDVAQLLLALADGGLGGAHTVFAFGGLGAFTHRDRGQAAVCVGGLGLHVQRSRQHQNGQRQQSQWRGGCGRKLLRARVALHGGVCQSGLHG